MDRSGSTPACAIMAHMDDTTAYFDSVASSYDEVLPFFSGFASLASARLPLRSGSRVLDVGAGRGALTRVALTRGCEVTAVDAAPAMVEHLRRDFPTATSAVMDAQALALDDASFDVALAAFVVHIVPDPQRAVAELARVAATGGTVGLLVPGRADGEPDPWTDPVQEVVAEFRALTPDGSGRHRGGDYDSEEQLLADAGLEDVTGSTLEVEIPVPDGETYWRWMNSHGAGTVARSLPERHRADFHDRVVATVDDLGGTTLRRSAAFWVATQPGPTSDG